ncbi:MAG: hypothetical protein E5V77_00190 [Mesorhizobium sp.]|nr:MAG: hypothetical protein E5V77_00190 [Mesorhizobium sp.]
MRMMSERFEADLHRAFYGANATNTTVRVEEKPFRVGEMLRLCERLASEARRNQLVFRADAAHSGAMLKIETPCDGSVIELSFMQAQLVHDKWPLKLHKVLNEHTAEFVPATQFDCYVPMYLPKPPFEIKEQEDA